MSEKKVITVQEVLSMLENGKSREEIREHFELNKTELKQLFEHPKLKGKKTKKAPSFIVIDEDDTTIESEEDPINVKLTPEEVAQNPNTEDDPITENDSIEIVPGEVCKTWGSI